MNGSTYEHFYLHNEKTVYAAESKTTGPPLNVNLNCFRMYHSIFHSACGFRCETFILKNCDSSAYVALFSQQLNLVHAPSARTPSSSH